MIDKFNIGRRALLGGAASAAALGLAGGAQAQKPLSVGFIYVGPRTTTATTRRMPRPRPS
jgi:hypothetical protein